MDRISKHISYREATYSPTAIKRGITNSPDASQLELMKKVANKCFEPAREYFGKPIYINSFFRSAALNSRIGGSTTSQHCCFDGAAAIDLDTREQDGFTNAELFNWLVENVLFDQIIWEFGSSNDPDWVHISYKEGDNRGQILRAKRVDGKITYSIMH